MCYSMAEMRARLAGLLAIGLLVWWAPQGTSTAWGADPSPGTASPPDLLLRQIHLVEAKGEVKLWEVWADRAEVRESEGVSLLSRVTRPVAVTLYFNQGRLTCAADRATVDLKTKDVRLDGGVVARSEQGMELRTDSIRWIAATRRLVTDQAVTVTRGSLVTRGRGLEAETSLERVRILQEITSSLTPGGGPNKAARKGKAR